LYSHIYQACNMERSAQKYFAIASLLGMHLMRTQSRIQKALHLCYSFFIFVLLAPIYFYIIIKEYSYISKFGESGGSEGLITVYFFILIYHVTLSIQHLSLVLLAAHKISRFFANHQSNRLFCSRVFMQRATGEKFNVLGLNIYLFCCSSPVCIVSH
jgi:uncharacterized membrane protein YozB (DUF420 family)